MSLKRKINQEYRYSYKMKRGGAFASSAKDELGLDTALLAKLQDFARRREENENLKKRLGNLEIKVQEQLEAKRSFLDSSCEA